MRTLVALGAAVLAACATEPVETFPASVYWMEWPLTAYSRTPVAVRLVGTVPRCRTDARLETTPTVRLTTVTFEPQLLGKAPWAPCVALDQVVITFDTVTVMNGVSAGTYDMRAGADWVLQSGARGLPIVSFGAMRVLPGIDPDSLPNPSPTAAAGGLVQAYRDTAGCLRIQALGMAGSYVVENPPDTTQGWMAMVEGYLYEPASGACGAQFVFHLTARK